MTLRRSFCSPEIFVCEASAGSGKTYALAERYVRLILHLSRNSVRPPVYSILAITFTNKAAFEMKERIIRFLKELALGVMDTAEQARMTEGLEMTLEQVRTTSTRVISEILLGYNYFQVQTIDRFINTLLVSSAFQIGLDSSFRIKSDLGEYLERAIDELIEEARVNAVVRKSFDDLLTSVLLVEARSPWMPKDVVFDTVLELFKEYNTYARPFVRGQVSPDDIWRSKIQVVDDVRAFVENMPEGIHKGVEKALRKFVDGGRRAFLFKGDLSAYFAKDAEEIKKFDIAGWHLDQWQKIRDGFDRAAEIEVRHLYDPYIELFERVREKLRGACVRDNVLFLAELNAKARMIFENGIAPQELYYRLSTRFEHYLFDEFQDTSLLQWENLKALPEDAIARGGSLFYVGDKKQAIFSFRGGDTYLFDAVRAQYADPGYNLFTHTLSDSRRSHKSIVDFNNAVFSVVNLRRFLALTPARASDFAELERVYGNAGQTPLKVFPEGYVRVEVLNGKDQEDAREDSLMRTVVLLNTLHERFLWKDIGVLVRKNSDVARWTRALLEAGIPAASERTLNIKEHQHVLEVVAFLRFLSAPEDNEAFAAAILGELVLQASGINVLDMQDFVLLWRQRRSEPFLYKAFQAEFPEVWDKLMSEFYQKAGLYPVYELIMSLFYRWEVLLAYPESRGFLMHLLELVRAKENDYPSLESFLDYFDSHDGEEFYASAASGADAVRVATVHKSKGLEHRVVILPFFTFGLDRSGARGSNAPRYVLRNVAEGLALYHFGETHTKYSTLADEEYVQEKMLTFFNELNNAYVALTRAVCEMYVFIPPKSGSTANMALQLLPAEWLTAGEPAIAYPWDKARDAGSLVVVSPPECRDWLGFLEDEFISKKDLVAYAERALGVAVHEALAKINYVRDSEVDHLLDEVLTSTPLLLVAEVRGLLKDFLSAEDIKPFFEQSTAQIYNEYEVVDKYGRSKRMDRLIVGSDIVTVLDFKVSRPDDLGPGLEQVRYYVGLLREIYSDKVVQGKLVFIREKAFLDV